MTPARFAVALVAAAGAGFAVITAFANAMEDTDEC